MKIGAAFPSKWLKAADLQGQEVEVVIKGVELADVTQGEEPQPVMLFHNKKKGMVINKTNADRMAHGYGTDETDEWPGRKLILYVERVMYKGQMTDGLRVRVPQPVQPAVPTGDVNEHPPERPFDQRIDGEPDW